MIPHNNIFMQSINSFFLWRVKPYNNLEHIQTTNYKRSMKQSLSPNSTYQSTQKPKENEIERNFDSKQRKERKKTQIKKTDGEPCRVFLWSQYTHSCEWFQLAGDRSSTPRRRPWIQNDAPRPTSLFLNQCKNQSINPWRQREIETKENESRSRVSKLTGCCEEEEGTMADGGRESDLFIYRNGSHVFWGSDFKP